MAIRFGLGVAEAAVFPAMLVYVSNWLTRAERSRANSLLILGGPATVLWMSVLSGCLIEAVGWRGMFIIEGLPTVLRAFLWWRLVFEQPADAPWLAPAEKAELAAALQREQAAPPPVRGYGQAFRSRGVQVLAWQYSFWSFSFFGFVLWLPSIIRRASSLGIVQTGWLSAAPYLLAMVALPLVSLASDRAGMRKPFIWPCLLAGAVAFAGL